MTILEIEVVGGQNRQSLKEVLIHLRQSRFSLNRLNKTLL